MSFCLSSHSEQGCPGGLALARLLLVHGDLAPRLSLKTILEAGGYTVDVAGTPEEAFAKLDDGEYELVLSDTELGSHAQARSVLAYARVKSYHPATALITDSHALPGRRKPGRGRQRVAIRMEAVPDLLEMVAELIGMRATRKNRLARLPI